MKLAKVDINEILHAAGCARQRGHSYQAELFIEIAKDYADKIGIKIEDLLWYKFSQGKF
jgi:hypothetical protein